MSLLSTDHQKEELTGLPDDFVNNLPKDDEGHYLISLRYPDLYPVLELADNDETRRKMDAVNSNKCKEVNVPLLKQVLQLRQGQHALQKNMTSHARVLKFISFFRSCGVIGLR